ncbi:MAG TPA: hypothetical protein IGS17_01335 [Oscillatoriales cyanobacterium M59_W2019_021]|nr:MAG: hypothetical protein D6728_15545 [Cyanobacteria bacterium J055]HIK30067.1 hypothetical protein [Oscillatoriales cyanobacterium M4454_W2019_049]HIK49557.1 hypothetical protein [Oscillatoriales cyanobacterium M59_W2019_021]
MKNSNCLISACRSCRYYSHQGRRGGQCQRLGVPVESTWKACSLAFPPFAPSWEHFEDLMSLKSEAAERHESLTPDRAEDVPTPVRASAPAVTAVPSQPILV